MNSVRELPFNCCAEEDDEVCCARCGFAARCFTSFVGLDAAAFCLLCLALFVTGEAASSASWTSALRLLGALDEAVEERR